MSLKFTVGSSFISENDIKTISSNEECLFEVLNYDNFSSSDLIIVLISLSSAISQNVIYDCLKAGFLSLVQLVKKKTKTKKFEMLIDLDGKKYSMEMSIELSEAQTDRIVDAAIKKLLE